ncbi:MAG: SGNH/GDSL hydrolase family protein [Burkholderiales bacterium]|nr:SGNH/GDSL hydrolase family protein [Burkholderiales bacterium]
MKMRRALLIFSILLSAIHPALAIGEDEAKPIQVLFVGNSLTYVGNLPAVLQHIAAANHRTIETDMIVRGGATLTERVDDGSVERALQAKHYDYLILQERGGDALGAFGEVSQKQVHSALQALSRIATTHKVKAISLGGYQPSQRMTSVLLEAERAIAAQAAIEYVDVQTSFMAGKNQHPNAEWLYADKGHPGHDLILLEAVLIFQHLFGLLPETNALVVNAPMYKPNSSFTSPAPTSLHTLTPDMAMSHHYSQQQLAAIVRIAQTQVE